MHDVEGVRATEPRRNLPRDVQRALGGDGPERYLVAQALALHVFEHQKDGAIRQLAEVGRSGDVRVIDVGGRHGFALEARHHLGHGRELAVQHLDRQALAHQHVLGRIHAPHTSFADQRVDAIAIGERRAYAGICPALAG